MNKRLYLYLPVLGLAVLLGILVALASLELRMWSNRLTLALPLLLFLGGSVLITLMYRDYIYKPLKDDEGNTNAIFIDLVDVTNKVEYRKQLQNELQEKTTLLAEINIENQERTCFRITFPKQYA